VYLSELRRLESIGGRTLQRYRDLLTQADAAQHNSAAANALAEFCAQWANDPVAVINAVEAAAKAAGGEP
jgi:hypothetical protein